MTIRISQPSKLYPTAVNLTNCDREPIHIIGKIQNHGCLIACNIENKIVTFASDNTPLLFDHDTASILGDSIYNVLDESLIGGLFEQLQKKSLAYKEISLKQQSITVIAHRSNDQFVLEFELNSVDFNHLRYQMKLVETTSEINNANEILDKCNAAASLIKKHLGYDRVMVYKFDADWNGEVIAEKRESHLSSWLGLCFPASDIPQQARQLFLKQGARIINDVDSPVIPVLSSKIASNKPLDLSRSELRAVSPIHLEYLNNMKVSATLTVAVVHDNLLWGLIACHHYSPKYINFYQRLSTKFLAQILATNIHLHNTDDVLEQIKKSSLIRSHLIEQINNEKDISKGLSEFEFTINDLTHSSGAAIYFNNEVTTVGDCPSDEAIIELIKKIRTLTDTQLYHTHCLKNDFEEGATYKSVASGVLCLFIFNHNNDAILWFKPEVLTTKNWAGNPNKSASENRGESLSPRTSFEKWSIQQESNSTPWEDHEISAGVSLQKNIQDIVMANYDEIKKLNEKLKMAYEELESFSYSISHDLRAPLRGIDGFAYILKEDYYDLLDDFGRSAVDTILSSTTKMNLLIDDILEYSSLGKNEISYGRYSVSKLVHEVLPELILTYNNVQVTVEDNIPDILCDRTIVLLLIKNLLENAMKYSAKVDEPNVMIGYSGNGTYFVKDNGIGFNIKHQEKIFGVFERLVNDDYPGSGIGLAIAKRVVNKHQGKIWVESKKNYGSTFFFRLNNLEK